MGRGWIELKKGTLTLVWQRLLAPMRGPLREEGQALVEFAMSCLVLIPILFGSIEACLGFYTYNFVADAAREATRYAMVRGSACTGLPDCNASAAQIKNYVQGLGYPGLTASNLNVPVTWLQANTLAGSTTWTVCPATPPVCNQPGNQVQVTVTYNFPLGIPFISKTPLNISSTSSMVISQ
jgi:Flp pilus assembly protein TadG